jgi:hypothetical protein
MDSTELYGVPLERFIEERNALAKQLRQGDRRDEAARVMKLRRPSLAAWAVNQLVRTQRREVDELFKAGDALQTAQADLVAGRGDPDALRRAVDAERAAADRLVDKARGLLSSQGHELTPAKLEQVSETLHAAALDQEARSRVQDGCLHRELRHIGLGALVAPSGAEAPRTAPRRAPARASTRKPRPDVKPPPEPKPDLSTPPEPQPELETPPKSEPDPRSTRRARRAIERTARALQLAQDRRDRAADALRQAEEELAVARQRAEDALRQQRPE